MNLNFFQILKFHARPALIAMVVATVVQPCVAKGAELLAHFEYACLVDNGCSHSVRTATEANFGIAVYPGRVDFRGYEPGETDDVTVPIDDFLTEFLTSGSLAAPEPMEFLAVMVNAGGGGQSVDKADLQMGVDREGPPVRVDAGYDVPLTNGVDLAGSAVLTGLRFQLLDLEISNSDMLAGSAMRAHYRYEFLGNRIPEPTSAVLLMLGFVTCTVSRHKA